MMDPKGKYVYLHIKYMPVVVNDVSWLDSQAGDHKDEEDDVAERVEKILSDELAVWHCDNPLNVNHNLD